MAPSCTVVNEKVWWTFSSNLKRTWHTMFYQFDFTENIFQTYLTIAISSFGVQCTCNNWGVLKWPSFFFSSSYRLTIIAERRHACHQFRSSGLTFFLRSRTFTSTFVVALESIKWLWTASVKSGLPSAFIDYKSSNETKKYAVHLLTFWSGTCNFCFFSEKIENYLFTDF